MLASRLFGLAAGAALLAGPAEAQVPKEFVVLKEGKLDLKRHINCLAFTTDGKWVAVGANEVHLLDAAGDEPVEKAVFKVDQFFGVHAVGFSPDGKFLAVGCADHTLRIWNVADAKEIQSEKTHTGGVGAVAYSPDGKWLVSGSEDQTALVWAVGDDGSVKEKAILPKDERHRGAIREVAFGEKASKVVTVNTAGSIRIFDLNATPPKMTYSGKANGSGDVAVAVGPGNKGIALSEGKFFEVQGVKTPFKAHSDNVTGLAYAPDGTSLASCGRDGKVIVWNTTTWKQRWSKERPDKFAAAAYSKVVTDAKPGGDTTLCVAGEEGNVYVFQFGFREKKK